MPEPIFTRPLEPDDRSLVERILIETWDATEFASCGQLVKASDLPGFVCFRGDQPEGLLTFHVIGDVCELLTLNAMTSWTGVGSMLLKAFEDHVRELDLARVFLITTNDNVDAIRFYQKRGWHLAELHAGAIDEVRRTIKPAIPEFGEYGIPIRDELVFELPVHL